jgi:hypothetical protein
VLAESDDPAILVAHSSERQPWSGRRHRSRRKAPVSSTDLHR